MLARLIAPIAAVGYLVSLASQIAFWFGVDLLGGAWPVIFASLAVVWPASAMLLRRHRGASLETERWQAFLGDAPPWMTPLLYGTFILAGLALLLGFGGFFSPGVDGLWRVGSSVATVFYGIAWGCAAAAIARDSGGLDGKCEAGHDLSPDARFCSRCGAPARRAVPTRSPGAPFN